MAYDFSNVNVLVVESSVAMFQLVKGVLHLLSVPDKNVHSAYTIDEGFEKFRSLNHDLIIPDWLQNPDRGIHLTRMIRTHKDTPNPYVPIIMTAGSGHYSRVIKARDAGVSEYLVKPFSAKALADRIVRIIEKPRVFVVSASYTGPERRIKSEGYTGPERRSQVAESIVAQSQYAR